MQAIANTDNRRRDNAAFADFLADSARTPVGASVDYYGIGGTAEMLYRDHQSRKERYEACGQLARYEDIERMLRDLAQRANLS